MKKLLVLLWFVIISCLFVLPTPPALKCSSPNILSGGAAQRVCLGDKTVLKQAAPCSHLDYKCHFRGAKQYYTNKNWWAHLNNHRAVAKMISRHPPEFQRIDHVDIPPNCVENMKRLTELDDLLGKHRMIMTDVNKINNIVLNNGGNVTLIDFNLFPLAVRPMIDKYDYYSKRINPFRNLYGVLGLDEWFLCT